MMYLQNDCVKLRNVCHEDAKVLMTLNNDPEIAKCVVGNPKKVTFEQQLKWMDRIKNETSTVRYMVTLNAIAVGTIIISNIDREVQTANLNIKFLREFQGKGIGQRSIALVLERCFSELNLYCVTAHILTDNRASQALFEKSGFKKEGTLRARVLKERTHADLISYSIIRPEYKLLISTR